MSGEDATPPPGEGLRADARRNRERIMEAAAEVFAEGGVDSGMAEVARRAGVGHATLFRRFPTKEALLIELLRQRMGQLHDAAAHEATVEPRGEALERFMPQLAAHFADRGFRDTSVMACVFAPELDEARRGFAARISRLLELGKEAGRIRDDISEEDVFFLCRAVSHRFNEKHRDPQLWRRYLGLVLDGMRATEAPPLSPPSPSLAELEARLVEERSAS